MPIAAIALLSFGDIAYSLSSVPLASILRWQGGSTAGPSHYSGRVLRNVGLSGAPDVIFLHRTFNRLYVAVGDPGVIDVIDVETMRRDEVVTTEVGAHTLALDRKRNKV